MKANRSDEFWYWVVTIAVIGAVWAGIAVSIAPTLAQPFIGGVLPSSAVVWAGAAAIVAVQLFAARFAGPFRASAAELAWRTHEVSPSVQIAQVAGCNTLITVVAGILLVTVALDIGYGPAATAMLIVLLVLSVPLGVTMMARRQGTTFRPRGSQAIPRWELIRASANVRGAAFSILTLSGEGLRAAANLRDSGVRVRLKQRGRFRVQTTSQGTALCLKLGARGIGRLWKREAVLLAIVCLSLALRLVDIALILAAIGCTWCSITVSSTWAGWLREPHIRAAFGRVRFANAAVLLGSSLSPLMLTIGSLTALGVWFALNPGALLLPACAPLLIPVALILPIVTIAARGRSALRGEDTEATFVNTPELGPIPVGQMSRLAAGWFGAGLIAAVSWANPPVGALLLAGWCAFLAPSFRQEFSRVKPHANTL